MNKHKLVRLDYIKKLVLFRQDMKFQYWFKELPSKTFYELDELPCTVLAKNEQLLRTSIEDKNLTEFRIDLDHESLEKNIELGLDIYFKLKKHNIKSSFYYSGGKGVHIHFLLLVNRLNLKIRNRKKFKQFFLQQLDILKYVDHAPLSPNTLLTLEGCEKRKSKTAYKKIYIDIEKNHTLDLILDYVEKNKFKTIINFDFLQTYNEIPETISLKGYFDGLARLNRTVKRVQTSKPTPKRKSLLRTALNEDKPKYKEMLQVFVNLYIKKQLKSNYRYPVYIVKYFIDKGLEKDIIENYFYLVCTLLNKSWDFESIYASAINLNQNYYLYLKSIIEQNIGFTYYDLKETERRFK